MKIRVWGCRGSIPTPGCDTDKYGGNTTCFEIRLNDGTIIIIDAGTGIRKLGRQLLKEKGPKDINLLLTHAHWDHLQGFPFFLPAYMPGYTIHVWGGPLATQSVNQYLIGQMTPPFFPVEFQNLQADFDFKSSGSEETQIRGAKIIPISLDHPNGGYGYKIVENDSVLVFLTDNELGFGHPDGLQIKEYADFVRGADLLLHDAQFTEEEYKITRSWGHSTYRAVVDFARVARPKRLGLIHHDPEHLDRELDRLSRHCRRELKKSGVDCFGVRENTQLEL